MRRKLLQIVFASLLAGFAMNVASFLFLTHKSDYASTFDWAYSQTLSRGQAVLYAARNIQTMTGLEAVRAGKTDRAFWFSEIGYVFTYAIAGILSCATYLGFQSLRMQ